MISDIIQRALPAVAEMSYETWVSILLAALAVLLAAVTLVVAIAGIAIALVGIWGIRALRKAAEQKAREAVDQTIAEYPDATRFIEVHQAMQALYRRMLQQMSEFKQEFEVLHQRSETANAILDRLSIRPSADASNVGEAAGEATDLGVERMSAGYPGEEAGSDDCNIGKPIKAEGAAPTDAR